MIRENERDDAENDDERPPFILLSLSEEGGVVEAMEAEEFDDGDAVAVSGSRVKTVPHLPCKHTESYCA